MTSGERFLGGGQFAVHSAIAVMGLAAALWMLCSQTATAQQPDETRYVYDTLGRLVRATYPNGLTVDYSYDVNSNRQTVRVVDLAAPPPSAGRLVTISTFSGMAIVVRKRPG